MRHPRTRRSLALAVALGMLAAVNVLGTSGVAQAASCQTSGPIAGSSGRGRDGDGSDRVMRGYRR